MIEHGVNYRNAKDSIHNIIFDKGKVKYNAVFDFHTGIPPIELVELEEEQDEKQSKYLFKNTRNYGKLCSANMQTYDFHQSKSTTLTCSVTKAIQ